jgi:hypothetical protein
MAGGYRDRFFPMMIPFSSQPCAGFFIKQQKISSQRLIPFV